jgi:hypothetical protein|tara:strand:+ start:3736 stop:4005 length:270 start_codon:yes stop_codon:yes gene_type:complete
MMSEIRTQLKNISGRLNMNDFTEPYKTDGGVSCIRRDSIAAFTTTQDEITVHLRSGTIFTITLSENEADIENITADLAGLVAADAVENE